VIDGLENLGLKIKEKLKKIKRREKREKRKREK
jgi:hypothetical protein